MRMRYLNFAFVSLWLLAFHYCRVHNYRDPSSYFFRPEQAYHAEYSNTRVLEAHRFIQKHAALPAFQTNQEVQTPKQTPRLCIGIPSFGQRPGDDHVLLQTLASLTDSLTRAERDSIHIAVLIVDNPPTQHPSFYTPQLTTFADDVLAYDGNINRAKTVNPFDAVALHPVTIPAGLSMQQKSASDFALVADACGSSEAPYFALIEDDVVASRDWFTKTMDGVESLVTKKTWSGRDWLYLRLFYSETFLGWNNEEWRDYATWIIIAYAFVGSCLVLATRSSIPWWVAAYHRAPKPSFKLFASVLGLWMPATIALYFLAGRLSVQPLAPGVRQMPLYGCCSQALVFPRRHVAALSSHLRNPKAEMFPDEIIEKWAEADGFTKWALVPSVVQHFGRMSSSIAIGFMKLTWNFSFEKQQ